MVRDSTVILLTFGIVVSALIVVAKDFTPLWDTGFGVLGSFIIVGGILTAIGLLIGALVMRSNENRWQGRP